jgi:TonB family protein
VEVPDGLRSTGSGGVSSGFGVAGFGAGGSGVGYGTIGLGSYATVGKGSAAPSVSYSGAYQLRVEDSADLAPPEPKPVDAPKPDVRGRIDASTYKVEIGKHVPALRGLFDQQLKTSTGIEGRYVLKLWIDATGSVSKVEITGKPAGDAAAAFAQKLAGAARTWSFEPPDTMTVVSYPIVFSEHK